jgi:prevent-host-death family protein
VKNVWQLQEAKNQFSAVAEQAVEGRPQIVTKHGQPFVVIVSVKQWEQSRPRRTPLVNALRACPADLTELDLRRSKELPREIAL